MAKAEIDIDVFLAGMKDLLERSVVKKETESPKPKVKRGRPSKQVPYSPLKTNPNAIAIYENIEKIPENIEISEADDEPPPSAPRRSSLSPVKRTGLLELEGRRAKKRKFEPPTERNKFDSMGVKNLHVSDSYSLTDPTRKIVYRRVSNRREQAEKVSVRCEQCKQIEEVFASEYMLSDEVETDRDGNKIYQTTRCNGCSIPR